jgi:hypothetical protein
LSSNEEAISQRFLAVVASHHKELPDRNATIHSGEPILVGAALGGSVRGQWSRQIQGACPKSFGLTK